MYMERLKEILAYSPNTQKDIKVCISKLIIIIRSACTAHAHAHADIPKTAIIMPFGLWEFLRMTFGLRNAGNSFQRYMDRVLSGLDFIFVYLDDSSSPAGQSRSIFNIFGSSSSGSATPHWSSTARSVFLEWPLLSF